MRIWKPYPLPLDKGKGNYSFLKGLTPLQAFSFNKRGEEVDEVLA
jgi:hypothetical protein